MLAMAAVGPTECGHDDRPSRVALLEGPDTGDRWCVPCLRRYTEMAHDLVHHRTTPERFRQDMRSFVAHFRADKRLTGEALEQAITEVIQDLRTNMSLFGTPLESAEGGPVPHQGL